MQQDIDISCRKYVVIVYLVFHQSVCFTDDCFQLTLTYANKARQYNFLGISPLQNCQASDPDRPYEPAIYMGSI